MVTLLALRTRVLTRLGDTAQQIWSAAEVEGHLRTAYDAIAALNVFFDMTYLEDRPAGFSVTAVWETPYGQALGFSYGVANYTLDDERRTLGDELARVGPAAHTSPFEVTDGWLAAAGADPRVPATSSIPADTVALDRATWDGRTIGQALPRELAQADSRYEVTRGPVEVLAWKGAGLETVRKYRVPAAAGDLPRVTRGPWGVLRTPADLSGEPVHGSFGLCRRAPGHHPVTPAAGPGAADYFGTPRRVFFEGKQTRAEVYRRGRPLRRATDVCELPDRYAHYLGDFAQAQLLKRAGPGQDLTLAALYEQRWTRNVTRLIRRVAMLTRERSGVMGAAPRVLGARPPRPQLPWNYGRPVR